MSVDVSLGGPRSMRENARFRCPPASTKLICGVSFSVLTEIGGGHKLNNWLIEQCSASPKWEGEEARTFPGRGEGRQRPREWKPSGSGPDAFYVIASKGDNGMGKKATALLSAVLMFTFISVVGCSQKEEAPAPPPAATESAPPAAQPAEPPAGASEQPAQPPAGGEQQAQPPAGGEQQQAPAGGGQ